MILDNREISREVSLFERSVRGTSMSREIGMFERYIERSVRSTDVSIVFMQTSNSRDMRICEAFYDSNVDVIYVRGRAAKLHRCCCRPSPSSTNCLRGVEVHSRSVVEDGEAGETGRWELASPCRCCVAFSSETEREENKYGAFGRGTVVPRIAKPAVVAAATFGQNVEAPVGAEPTVNVSPSSVDRVTGILQKVASTVAEFGKVMADIGKQRAPVNVMRKTFSGISNTLNVASTMEAPSTPTASQLDDIFYGSETFTTAVDALLQLEPTEDWMNVYQWKKKKKENFYQRMACEIDRLQNLDITDADLIFFAVLRHGHYFLVCINIKASKVEIIDNKALLCGVTKKDKYGDCTNLLVDELTEEVLNMHLKETENYIDCGIFVIRNMETYNGTLKKWNPGFKRKASLNADVDNSGTIDYGEFIAAMLHINKITKEDHLFAAFSYFYKDGSGYITADELQKACDEFGIKDTRLEEMIQEADEDNDGRIDYSEFVSMMQRGTTTMHRASKNEDITTASYCAIYLDSPYKSAKNHRQLAW
nr:Calcium-dependent protein kinase 1 [Ipomoea batatas]